MVDPSFTELVRQFVYDRFALEPVAATVAGMHDHDHTLGDLTADGFAARNAFTTDWLARFEQVTEGLSQSQDVDRELLLSDLRGERAMFALQRWRRYPGLYSDLITRGAYYALLRQYGTIEERLALRGVAARGPRAEGQGHVRDRPRRVRGTAEGEGAAAVRRAHAPRVRRGALRRDRVQDRRGREGAGRRRLARQRRAVAQGPSRGGRAGARLSQRDGALARRGAGRAARDDPVRRGPRRRDHARLPAHHLSLRRVRRRAAVRGVAHRSLLGDAPGRGR